MAESLSGWRRNCAREALVILLFIALSAMMTWPLLIYLDRAISDPGDPFFTTWAIDWDYHAATTTASLFNANIFYPAPYSLAFSEHMLGVAVLLFPLLACGLAPLTAHNLAMLLGFAGCGYTMYLLGRWVTGSTLASVVGGIAFAFVGFRFHHLPHVHFVWSLWLPLLLLGILKLADQGRASAAALFAVASVFNGLTSLHWLVFGMTASAITAIVIAAVRRRVEVRFWVLLLAATSLAFVVMAPFLWPYHVVRELYHMERRFAEIYPNSADWRDWFYAYYKSTLYGRWSPDAAIGHERTLFPGLTVCFLAVAGVLLCSTDIRERRWVLAPRLARILTLGIVVVAILVVAGAMIGHVRIRVSERTLLAYAGVSQPLVLLCILIISRITVAPFRFKMSQSNCLETRSALGVCAGLTWSVVGMLGARGLHGFFHTALFKASEAFQGIRVPTRWAMITYVGLSLLATVGMAELTRNSSRFRQLVVALLLGAAILCESWVRPIRWYLVPLERRAVYSWLKATPLRGGILELPMEQWFTYEYLWRATIHHRPLINGVSSYTPPEYEALFSLYQDEPIRDEFLHALERLRCSVVVVHEGWLRERSARIRRWLYDEVQTGRLVFVRRFDAGAGADYVFAVTAVEPGAMAWREPEVPDPAGRTPAENAAIFLGPGGWTYSSNPIVNVDLVPRGTIHGRLTIAGWSLAAEGERAINLRFANGTYVFSTKRYARADVSAALPWHPDASTAGFLREFDGPPRGIDGDTDLQIEVVTQTGRVVRKAPFLFAWRRAMSDPPKWNEAAVVALLEQLHAEKEARARLISGSAGIEDFVDPLVTDPTVETDAMFADRVLRTLLGRTDEHLRNHYWSALADGVSRKRVVEEILRSPEFAAKYLLSGSVTGEQAKKQKDGRRS